MPSTPSSNQTRKTQLLRLMRFGIGGVINTGVTFGLYLAFNEFVTYQLAYLMAYITGIIFAYWFNAVIVFKVTLNWADFFSYPIIYVIQYISSALLLGLLVEWFDISEVIAPILVVLVLFPVTFILNKLLLTRKKQHSTQHPSI